MSKRDNNLLLEDIVEAASKIRKYTSDHDYSAFIEDDRTMDAVIRNFEIIGEAANRIDPDFKSHNPQVDWRRIIGFRNRVVHDYIGIDYEIVWQIIQEDLEELVFQIKELLDSN
ncbi:MAG: DUF86 domain-containing protein [Cyclobacteriaceae bacterium]